MAYVRTSHYVPISSHEIIKSKGRTTSPQESGMFLLRHNNILYVINIFMIFDVIFKINFTCVTVVLYLCNGFLITKILAKKKCFENVDKCELCHKPNGLLVITFYYLVLTTCMCQI